MAVNKKFQLLKENIRDLLPHRLGCIATNYITMDGLPVDYMRRDNPVNELDSGWRFQANKETQRYLDNPQNSMVYALNTIANYDEAIIPYLDLPIGTELERVKKTDEFVIISQ